MILHTLEISHDQLKSRMGWEIKPQGACKAEVCIPLPSPVLTTTGFIDVSKLAERLRMPLVHDQAAGLWVLGPEGGTKALTTAVAPDFELPDWQGQPFRLSSLRGKKVLLVAWASWWGCRFDLPVWQALREELYPQGLEIVTVALDTLGTEVARPFIEAAKTTHPALIDEAHLLDELFGIVNVPSTACRKSYDG